MTEFTPISAGIGGAFIGLAVAMLMLSIGRIAGISGIASGVLEPQRGEWTWQLSFLIGLAAAPPLMHAAGYPLPHLVLPGSAALIAVAGLLVGFGTRLSGGCTSGHGLCGVARLSSRSIVAAATFMSVAMIVVALMRHVIAGTL
jgi:uncharacterized protein